MEKSALFNQRKWLFFVGIKALIVKDGKILILAAGHPELSSTRRKRVFWDLPGGKIEWGENIGQTLFREVEEEIGVPRNSVKVVRIFDASVSKIKISHAIRVPLILITYICKLSSGRKIKLSDEHTTYKWADLKTAKRLLGTKFNKTFIKQLDTL